MTIDTVIKVIGLLIQVITVAMKTFEDIMEKGSGKTKKELVMLLAKDALGDETFAKFESLISIFINIKALLTFKSTGDDPI
jgi:NADH:ubiquinone oxidoreductase subunit 2 (subunit N)